MKLFTLGLLCLSSVVAVMRLKVAQDFFNRTNAKILKWRIAHGYKPPPPKLKKEEKAGNLLSRILYATGFFKKAKAASASDKAPAGVAGVAKRRLRAVLAPRHPMLLPSTAKPTA